LKQEPYRLKLVRLPVTLGCFPVSLVRFPVTLARFPVDRFPVQRVRIPFRANPPCIRGKQVCLRVSGMTRVLRVYLHSQSWKQPGPLPRLAGWNVYDSFSPPRLSGSKKEKSLPAHLAVLGLINIDPDRLKPY
jgi:hypothetical protein